MKMDLSPLRDSRDYRLLIGSGVITMFGTFMTMVAVPYQMKELTGSYVAVGLVSLAEFVPMVVCGLWGGAIADALDRRKIILLTEMGLCLTSGLLWSTRCCPPPADLGAVRGRRALGGPGQPAAAQPGGADPAGGQARPAHRGRGAEQPALEPRRDRRPGLGGLLVAAWFGAAVAYGVDTVDLPPVPGPALAVKAVPPAEDAAPASLSSLVEGVRYAAGRP